MSHRTVSGFSSTSARVGLAIAVRLDRFRS